MKNIDLSEASKVVGGTWKIECYRIGHPNSPKYVYSDKSVSKKKADKLCGDYYYSSRIYKV